LSLEKGRSTNPAYQNGGRCEKTTTSALINIRGGIVRTFNKRLILGGGLAVVLLAAAACGGSSGGSTGSSGNGGGKTGTVALLLPETTTTRYEAHDKPEFVAALKALCSSCKVLYYNANQDANLQANQVDQALTNGAKVLVLDPVDSASAASLVAKAKAQNVGVVSYDRLVTGGGKPDYYVSYDNAKVGQLQGTALLTAIGANATKGKVVMINGAPTDNNAKLFKQGAHSVLDGKVTIGAEFDTPMWLPAEAQKEMDQAITRIGKGNIIGVYAANDGTAGGAIAALRTAGVSQPPPVTGQDSDLAGIQRIVAGQQYMTVYKGTKKQTEVAAQLAYDLLQGKASSLQTTPVNNGSVDVPSVLLQPIAVTKTNVKVVLDDNYWTIAQVCAGAYASACAAAGLS
jgi:D-xylose transport system substrate-binding protein